MAKTEQISPPKPQLMTAKDYQCGVLAVDHQGQLFIAARERGRTTVWVSLSDGHTQNQIANSRIVDAEESYKITQN